MEAENRQRWSAYDINLLLRLREMQDQFDIVHNHMGWQALSFLDTLRTAVVSTNHNPIAPYCKDIYLAYSRLPCVSISNAYRKYNYEKELNYVATVYNGIETEIYNRPKMKQLNYLLFMGRISKAKGTADAIRIARAVGLPLKIAGKVDLADRDYFEREVEPQLGGSGIEYIGEIGSQEKTELYSGALAVVYPIAFEEPFGLVMAESLASGTPVLALDRGSVRELLSDGETAIIGRSIEELIARFPQIYNLKEGACRERAAGLFGKERMTASYLQVYGRLVNPSPVNAAGVENERLLGNAGKEVR
jgi:glycosyltransferase involved in cell wall biosynthesis